MFDSIDFYQLVLTNKTFMLVHTKKPRFRGILSKTVSKSLFHRRPAMNDADLDYCAAAPTYSAAPINFSFLSFFDICFVIDNSGIMSAHSWRETKEALKVITSICSQHHADGIEVYFLNGDDRKHIATPADVENSFASVQPRSGTSVGSKLLSIVGPYLLNLEQQGKNAVKPLNIIVISCGKAGDDVKSVILPAARKLDKLETPAWQVGIQFCQVGNDPDGGKWHAELDATLGYKHERDREARNICRTIPWMEKLDGQGILACAFGAVDGKYR